MIQKVKIIALISLIMTLIILNAGCGPKINSRAPTTTSEPTKAVGSKSEQMQTTQTQQSMSTPEPEAPIVFQGNCPERVNAGEPFSITFSIKNNTDVPIIAANLAFMDLNMAKKIWTDQGWGYTKVGLQSNPNIGTQNIFIKKGQTLNSKFSLLVMNPGTYQFKVIPSVEVGDWKSTGEYIVSFQVSDTPEAKKTRDINSAIQSNNQNINDIEDKIKRLQEEIKNNQDDIDYRKGNIKYYQDLVDDYRSNKKDNPGLADSYDANIETTNEQIKDENNEIDQIQAKIDAAKKEILTLKADRIKLVEQNIHLKG